MKSNFPPGFALVAVLALFFCSCEKDQPACKNNCLDVVISGRTYVKTDGAAIPNVPVEVKWFRSGYCIGCTSYRVAEGVTRNDGTFTFNTTIDTSFFRDHHLNVRVSNDSNYIVNPLDGRARYYEKRFYEPNFSALTNIPFEFYPKTKLTIKLNRTLNDHFDYFSVDYFFTDRFGIGTYLIAGTRLANDTTLQVETSADLYTRITWKKTVAGQPSNQQQDSIFCTRNGPNVFTINY